MLIRSGREEQAMLTTLAGLIVVLFMIIGQISTLFDTIKRVQPLVGGAMDIIQVVIIGIIGTILTITVKQYKPELAALLALRQGF